MTAEERPEEAMDPAAADGQSAGDGGEPTEGELPGAEESGAPEDDEGREPPDAEEGEALEDEPPPGDDSERMPGLEKAPPLSVDPEHLKSVLESLIFVADKPLTDRMLAKLAHARLAEVRGPLHQLVREYEGRGIELVMVGGGYQFRSATRNAPFVRAFVAPKPVRLSRAQIETLSIVAYRQPVTRPEVDEIRGVDSGSALKVLTDRNLVKVLGRKDEPGRPLLYGTSPHFLEFFGLNSLRDLPTLQEFAELSDESRALFERRMGEPLDLKSLELEAQAAQAEASAQAELFDQGEDEEARSDELDDAEDGASSTDHGETPVSDASHDDGEDEEGLDEEEDDEGLEESEADEESLDDDDDEDDDEDYDDEDEDEDEDEDDEEDD